MVKITAEKIAELRAMQLGTIADCNAQIEKIKEYIKSLPAMKVVPKKKKKTDVHVLMHDAFDFLCTFDNQARVWRRKEMFSDEDKRQLVSAVHQVSNALNLLAQDLE